MAEQKASLEKIVSFMKEENDWVKSFDAQTIGLYEPEDAIWNYKDAPHLNCIHSLAMGCQALLSDDHVAALHTQKIMGFKLPMTLVEYQFAPNELVYFSTIIFFTLLVNTKVTKEEEKTVVSTRYYVAGPWFTKPLFYLLRRMVLKNYKVLMSEDIPMRDRKAELRAAGYTFTHDKTDHSWINSTKIAQNNVLVPAKKVEIKIDLRADMRDDGEFLFGDSGLFGIRVQKQGDNFAIYPRLCMHEGACLDKQKSDTNGVLKCPWHARNIYPLAKFNMNSSKVESSNDKFSFTKINSELEVKIG